MEYGELQVAWAILLHAAIHRLRDAEAQKWQAVLSVAAEARRARWAKYHGAETSTKANKGARHRTDAQKEPEHCGAK